MSEDSGVLVCFRGDLVWFLDTLKPWFCGNLKPKTKCPNTCTESKKTYIAREEKPVLKECAYLASFERRSATNSSWTGLLESVIVLLFSRRLLTTKHTCRALPFRLVNIRCFRRDLRFLVSKETGAASVGEWKHKFCFIKRVDKGWIANVRGSESWRSSVSPSSERIEELWGVVGLYESVEALCSRCMRVEELCSRWQ